MGMSIESFVDQVKAHVGDFHTVKVRGMRLSRQLRGVIELRTTKNTYLAAAFDDVGNVTVLTRRGIVKQIDGRDYLGH